MMYTLYGSAFNMVIYYVEVNITFEKYRSCDCRICERASEWWVYLYTCIYSDKYV